MASVNIPLKLTILFIAFVSPFEATFREAIFIKVSPRHQSDDSNIIGDCTPTDCTVADVCIATSVLSTRHLVGCFKDGKPESPTGLEKSDEPKCGNGGRHKDNTRPQNCRYWRDCSEGFYLGNSRSGIYTIQPNLSLSAFKVYCEMKWHGRTYIQRRRSGTDFYRNWTQYRNGFGNVMGDHWLGLEKIKAIADNRNLSLVVEVWKSNSKYKQRYFQNFSLTTEADGYKLEFGDSIAIPKCSLPDHLSELKGSRFTTFDRDQDENPAGNCAKIHHSGWWFKNCTSCNPNGKFKSPKHKRSGDPARAFWPECRPMTKMFMALSKHVQSLDKTQG